MLGFRTPRFKKSSILPFGLRDIRNGLVLDLDFSKIAGSTVLDVSGQKNKGKIIEDFDDISGDWTKISSGGSIADETTIVKENEHSLKLTSGDGTNCYADKTVSLDLSAGNVISFWLNLPSLTGVSSVAIYLASDSGYAKYHSKTIQATVLHEGWNYVEISKGEFNASGGEVWTDPKVKMRLRINASSGTPIAYFGRIRTELHRQPKILFTFDDGWESAYTEGLQYLESIGLKGTQYMIRDHVGDANYMSLAQCQQADGYGHDLGVHGSVNLTTLGTQAEQETEISYNEQFLIDNGFIRAQKHYAYPNGGYDDNALAALAALGYKTARTIIDRQQANVIDEQYLLTRYGVYNTTSLATAKTYIDRAIEQGSSVILNFHKLVASPRAWILNGEFLIFRRLLIMQKQSKMLTRHRLLQYPSGIMV